MSARDNTGPGTLARRGFTNARRAVELIDGVGLRSYPTVIEALGDAADPDLALLGLIRMVESVPDPTDLLARLDAEADLRTRLTAVLGASAALGDHLARHGQDWRLLQGPLDAPTPPQIRAEIAQALDTERAEPGHALRLAYRRAVLRLAARDLTGVAGLEEVGAELAELAGALLDGALTLARSRDPEAAAQCRLAVIGMGKCGGRELNYVSDVDVVFVAEPAADDDEVDEHRALRAATRLATATLALPSATDAEGTLWQVDTALRPEGKNGPLVRTLASHHAYYERWAKTWEFQALLKARPIAGDTELGARYVAALSPLVWQAANRDGFVDEVQAMRRRVEARIPPAQADRELKLGRGGLRDIEFAVQLLQLVHGRTDEALRSANTISALQALSAGGYVGRDDAASLVDAYRLFRHVEHLLQLHHLRRTHLLPDPSAPDGPRDLRRIGRALGDTVKPGDDFPTMWRRRTAEVRRLHEKLFYRPLLQAVARLPGEEARLSPEQAGTRLRALGFADPSGALRHLEALSHGVTRRAAIQRTLLPVMLGYFADAPDPDAGLLGFRQVSEALGTTPWYLRLLRDDVRVAERMARLLGTSRYATDLLLRAPAAVAILKHDTDLVARPTGELRGEADAVLRRHATAEQAVTAVRGLRRRELLRTAAADLLGVATVEEVGEALTAISCVTIDAALRAAIAETALELGRDLSTRVSVIGMGRFGGEELSYASDADVMYVHDPLPGAATEAATADAELIVRRLRQLLEMPSADPPLPLDVDLRPEGRSGPVVRSLESYARYYERWAATWESQALLRARPVAGDADLGARFRDLIDPIRYSAAGLSAEQLREIRRLKARMEGERLPRGADPTLHTKLGRGGLSDVEWVVQLHQLRHGHDTPTLRTTSTLPALRAAVDADLIAADDAEILATAWRMASAIRSAVTLVRGRGSDSIPSNARERRAVAEVLGYRHNDVSPGEHLAEDYRRVTRRARTVMERLFYDE